MIVKTRTTAQGTEYWDTKEKRVRFVPKGKKPSFEVTKDSKSMVGEPDESPKSFTPINKAYEDMTVKELKEYAAENNLNIPSDVKTKPDLIKFITESELALGIYDDDNASNEDASE